MGMNPGSLNPQVISLAGGGPVDVTGTLTYEWETFVDGDTTPDISGGSRFKTANTAPTTITDFDNQDPDGQTIIVLITDANTTIQDASSGSNIRLAGGMDFDFAAYDTLEFEYDGADWVEKSRNLK